MKFVLAGYVRITSQIQDMSDITEAWKVLYSYKNFAQININNNFFFKKETILHTIFIIYI